MRAMGAFTLQLQSASAKWSQTSEASMGFLHVPQFKKKTQKLCTANFKTAKFSSLPKKTQKLFNPVVPQTPAGKKTRGADDAILNRGCAECFQDDNLKFRPDAAIAGNVSPRNCCSSACHCTHAYNLFLGTPVQPSVKCGYTSASQMNSSTTSVFTFFSPFY